MSKNLGGRPTVMTEEAIAKLESSLMEGQTILDACFVAGISKDAYYDYVNNNPGYNDRVDLLRNTPNLKAKKAIDNALDIGDKDIAKCHIERKEPDYAKKSEVKQDTKLVVEGITMEEAMEMTVEDLEKMIKE